MSWFRIGLRGCCHAPSSSRAGSRTPRATPERGSTCRQGSPASLRDPPSLVADTPGQEDEDRYEREREQGQLPAEEEHSDHRRDHGRDVEAIDAAVLVRTFWTAPMSFEICALDLTGPVRVKNASDSLCRCRYTAVRRSCITRCPT